MVKNRIFHHAFRVKYHQITTVLITDVHIGLPNKVLIENCNVIESEINSPNIEILIGMDIIQMGDFAIANAMEETTFSYCIPPHRKPIDLFEKSNSVNPKRKL